MSERSAPPVFVHFFNWFWGHEWQAGTIVDPFDWARVGTEIAARGTQPFYERQFEYIKRLGITNIAWQFSALPEPYGDYSYPKRSKVSGVAEALQQVGMKMAPFYDLEMSMQAHRKMLPRPLLVNQGLIKADPQTVELISRELSEYYGNVPPELTARDRNGDAVIFVFGYGFNDDDPNPEQWSWFARELVTRVSQHTGPRLKFYWSCTNSNFQEHLFLHHRDHFTPFHFVVDTPQSQFSHDSITWNFGFDNLYVKRAFGLKRVVRLDPRYVEEAAWLARATDPALIFIYGWDEQYESSLLFPTRDWGDDKSRLAKHYIERLGNGEGERLPPVLLIVDDLDDQWSERAGDWHLTVLREMLLYRLRLFAPQADVVTPAEVTPELISRYQGVIDLTSEKTRSLIDAINAEWNRARLLLFDPLGPLRTLGHIDRFFESASYTPLNRDIAIEGSGETLAARDDSHAGAIRRGSSVKLWGVAGDGGRIPLVITNRNATFVNSYANNEEVMRRAFEQFYLRPMSTSILYGEGLRSQRLEQEGQETVRNTLLRYSVNLRWPIPPDIDWYHLPPEVEESDFNFVFGLDD